MCVCVVLLRESLSNKTILYTLDLVMGGVSLIPEVFSRHLSNRKDGTKYMSS